MKKREQTYKLEKAALSLACTTCRALCIRTEGDLTVGWAQRTAGLEDAKADNEKLAVQ